MPKSRSTPGPSSEPMYGRSLRVRLTEEEYRRLRLLRAYSDVVPSELIRADLERHYQALVVPHLAGNGHSHINGKGRPKAGA